MEVVGQEVKVLFILNSEFVGVQHHVRLFTL